MAASRDGAAVPTGVGQVPPLAMETGNRGGGEVSSTSSTKALYSRPLEEYLTTLRKGAWLLKHGRYGKPKLHFFRLVNHDTQLAWRSSNGARRMVDLARVSEAVRGQTTEVFRRNPQDTVAALSFSLLYASDNGGSAGRSLDLICPGEDAFELWYGGVKAIVDNLNSISHSLSIPPYGKAVKPTALPPRGSGAGGAAAALAHQQYQQQSVEKAALSIAAASQNLQPKPVLGRVSGDIGLPVLTRTPGDLWLWGMMGAQQQPPQQQQPGGSGNGSGTGSQPPSARDSREMQQQQAARGVMPRLAQETKQLDVLKVAAGTHHCALISYGGELYTWGEGRGGKLGHGSGEDLHQPQRVNTLWGKKVQSIRCSASVSAALTVDNELFTWGDGAAGTLGYPAIRQYIPQRVPLPTGVAHVALGPYHAAAVTVDGRLFTWGDGMAGKLGHGSHDNVVLPKLVQALADLRVLHVACGYWHTAAIAQEKRLQGSESDVGHITSEPSGSSSSSMSLASPSTGANSKSANTGSLFTWGGDLSWKEILSDAGGGREVKHDSHRGCLGLGNLQGQLLPTRVGGLLDRLGCLQVVAGLNFTAAVGHDRRVYQAGELAPSGSAPWSSCRAFVQVGGALAGYLVDELACGLQHCAATARMAERRPSGAVVPSGPRVVLTWGRGQEGQLGVGGRSDSASPVLVVGLSGKKVQQVAAGGHRTLVVAEHNTFSEDVEERAQLQEAKSFFKMKAKEEGVTGSHNSSAMLQRATTFVHHPHLPAHLPSFRSDRTALAAAGLGEQLAGGDSDSAELDSQSSNSDLISSRGHAPSTAAAAVAAMRSRTMTGRLKALAQDLRKSKKGGGRGDLMSSQSLLVMPRTATMALARAAPQRIGSMRSSLQRSATRSQGAMETLRGSHESGFAGLGPLPREAVSEGGGSVMGSSMAGGAEPESGSTTGGGGGGGGNGCPAVASFSSLDNACEEAVSPLDARANGASTPRPQDVQDLQARIAKLEAMLAQRTQQNDELAAQLAQHQGSQQRGAAQQQPQGPQGSGSSRSNSSAAPAFSPRQGSQVQPPVADGVVSLLPGGGAAAAATAAAAAAAAAAEQPAALLEDRRASLAAQQQLVLRRLQDAAAKEAEVARRVAEYERKVAAGGMLPAQQQPRNAKPPAAAPPVRRASTFTAGIASPPVATALMTSCDSPRTTPRAEATASAARSRSAPNPPTPAAAARDSAAAKSAAAAAGTPPFLSPEGSVAGSTPESTTPGSAAGGWSPAPSPGRPLPINIAGGASSPQRPASADSLQPPEPCSSPVLPHQHEASLLKLQGSRASGSPPPAGALPHQHDAPPLQLQGSGALGLPVAGAVAVEAGPEQGQPVFPPEQGAASQLPRRVGDTWTEEVDKGVFLCMEHKADGPQLVRIRFSRRKYSKEAAEAWYVSNRKRIADRYSQLLSGAGGNGGAGDGDGSSSTGAAGPVPGAATGRGGAEQLRVSVNAARSLSPRLRSDGGALSPGRGRAAGRAAGSTSPSPPGQRPLEGSGGSSGSLSSAWLDLPSSPRAPPPPSRLGGGGGDAFQRSAFADVASSPPTLRTGTGTVASPRGGISVSRSAPLPSSPRTLHRGSGGLHSGSSESLATARSDSMVESEPRRGAVAAAAAAAVAGGKGAVQRGRSWRT